jgi:hypothetical protein
VPPSPWLQYFQLLPLPLLQLPQQQQLSQQQLSQQQLCCGPNFRLTFFNETNGSLTNFVSLRRSSKKLNRICSDLNRFQLDNPVDLSLQGPIL